MFINTQITNNATMKTKKPTSPGSRFITKNDFKELTKGVKPLKCLLVSKNRISGRDNKGRITIRHRGGGAKRMYRLVDMDMRELGEKVEVVSIEYDPNRTGYIARVKDSNGRNSYVLAVDGIKVGQNVEIGEKAIPKNGNRTALNKIPIGTAVCNVELNPGSGGVLARSAGASVQLNSIDAGYAQVTLNSGEVRLIKENCMATLGVVSNKKHHNERIGKAGVSRHKGKRPTVRGSVMNPVDHPHGGGEGKAPVGLRKGPKTPWGKLAFGVKTRKKKKYSSKFIVKRRKK